jgi:hypothetical protein
VLEPSAPITLYIFGLFTSLGYGLFSFCEKHPPDWELVSAIVADPFWLSRPSPRYPMDNGLAWYPGVALFVLAMLAGAWLPVA